MSKDERAEIVAAIEAGSIDNATEYAREFALEHGLNASTVRSTISRLRRELGLLERPSSDWLRKQRLAMTGPVTGKMNPATGSRPDTEGVDRTNALTLLGPNEITDERLGRLAAAAMVRYEEDEDFRQMVDRERPAMRDLYRRLNELRESMANLPREELEELVRFTASMQLPAD